jgi:hypothetical protein
MGFNIDADIRNADWTKRSWDLVGIDSVEKLKDYLNAAGMSVEQFKKLPIYLFNVDTLSWLKAL